MGRNGPKDLDGAAAMGWRGRGCGLRRLAGDEGGERVDSREFLEELTKSDPDAKALLQREDDLREKERVEADFEQRGGGPHPIERHAGHFVKQGLYCRDRGIAGALARRDWCVPRWPTPPVAARIGAAAAGSIQ